MKEMYERLARLDGSVASLSDDDLTAAADEAKKETPACAGCPPVLTVVR